MRGWRRSHSREQQLDSASGGGLFCLGMLSNDIYSHRAVRIRPRFFHFPLLCFDFAAEILCIRLWRRSRSGTRILLVVFERNALILYRYEARR